MGRVTHKRLQESQQLIDDNRRGYHQTDVEAYAEEKVNTAEWGSVDKILAVTGAQQNTYDVLLHTISGYAPHPNTSGDIK